VFVADSFKGLPKPNVEAFAKDAGLDWSMVHELAVSLECGWQTDIWVPALGAMDAGHE
jgi:hypothetical protein